MSRHLKSQCSMHLCRPGLLRDHKLANPLLMEASSSHDRVSLAEDYHDSWHVVKFACKPQTKAHNGFKSSQSCKHKQLHITACCQTLYESRKQKQNFATVSCRNMQAREGNSTHPSPESMHLMAAQKDRKECISISAALVHVEQLTHMSTCSIEHALTDTPTATFRTRTCLRWVAVKEFSLGYHVEVPY